MKCSTYHKDKGDIVGFSVNDPEMVYVSCIFDWNATKAKNIAFWYRSIGCKVDLGGSGINLEFNYEIDNCYPDYSLYTMDYDLGFSSRGCNRKCGFCIVPGKEGHFRTVQGINDWHDPTHKKVVFMDNNILFDKEWFLVQTQYCLDNRLKVDFNQGLDVRLIDEEICKRLRELMPIKRWRIAFDTLSYKTDVIRAVGMMVKSGIKVRSNVICYVYLSGDDDIESAIERCNILKRLNVQPYIMVNRHAPKSQKITDLKRWARPAIFWKTDFEGYKR